MTNIYGTMNQPLAVGAGTVGVIGGAGIGLRVATLRQPLTRPGLWVGAVAGAGVAGAAIDRIGDQGPYPALTSAAIGAAAMTAPMLLAEHLTKPIADSELRPWLQQVTRGRFKGGIPCVTGRGALAHAVTGAALGAALYLATRES